MEKCVIFYLTDMICLTGNLCHNIVPTVQILLYLFNSRPVLTQKMSQNAFSCLYNDTMLYSAWETVIWRKLTCLLRPIVPKIATRINCTHKNNLFWRIYPLHNFLKSLEFQIYKIRRFIWNKYTTWVPITVVNNFMRNFSSEGMIKM